MWMWITPKIVIFKAEVVNSAHGGELGPMKSGVMINLDAELSWIDDSILKRLLMGLGAIATRQR